jgi:hypothetical protein
MARSTSRDAVASRLGAVINDYVHSDFASLTGLVQVEKMDGGHVSWVTFAPRGKPTIHGELRRLNPATVVGIEALIARGILRAMGGHGKAFVAIAVPALSESMITELREALEPLINAADQSTAASFAWLIFSEYGGRIIRIPAWRLKDERSDDRSLRWRDSMAASPKRLSFSDSNEVVLKHLLYSSVYSQPFTISKRVWGGEQSKSADVNQVASATGIGKSSVYRLMQELWARKIADWRTVRITGWATVLREWMDQASMRSRPQWIPIRPLYETGSDDAIPWIRDLQKGTSIRMARSGWWALDYHHLTAVSGDLPKTVVVESSADLGRILTAKNVRACSVDEAWCWVGVAQHRRSAFSGAIDDDGVFVEDVWQAALDVVSDPNRGYEQATQVASYLGVRIA